MQGVGSKVALAILSALTPGELRDACGRGDAASVARAQGVGPKLAGRIVNELKDKAGAMPGRAAGGGFGGGAVWPAGGASADAVSGLAEPGVQAGRCGAGGGGGDGGTGRGRGRGELDAGGIEEGGGVMA